jgi:hypothetical protein
MYLLFAGDQYYPLGGWKDFKGRFESEVETMVALNSLSCDWWQLVKAATLEVVNSSCTGRK